MTKYDPLNEYLKKSGRLNLRLTFAEIEKILNDKLPASAYVHEQWWLRGGHTQDKAWLEAGYMVDEIDLNEQIVNFHQ